MADVRVPPGELEQLQRNVVRSHCLRRGRSAGRAEVRAMMLIRANVLAKGFSGIRPLVAERLCDLLNRGVTPVVPSQGSVGASGDLAPLAHMALVLIGEGEAEFEGALLPGAEALRRAGIEPIVLASKEGHLAGQRHAGDAGDRVPGTGRGARSLADSADSICAMTLDALRGTPRAFDPRIHAARPHPGPNAKRGKSGAAAGGQRDSRNRTSPAAACRMPIRCAALRRCTARCAIRWPRRGASSRSN